MNLLTTSEREAHKLGAIAPTKINSHNTACAGALLLFNNMPNNTSLVPLSEQHLALNQTAVLDVCLENSRNLADNLEKLSEQYDIFLYRHDEDDLIKDDDRVNLATDYIEGYYQENCGMVIEDLLRYSECPYQRIDFTVGAHEYKLLYFKKDQTALSAGEQQELESDKNAIIQALQ